MSKIETLGFLTPDEVNTVASRHGTPVFVYDEESLLKQADEALAFDAPYGLTVRYAMKANPNSHILRIFDQQGIEIDASSGYEGRTCNASGH